MRAKRQGSKREGEKERSRGGFGLSLLGLGLCALLVAQTASVRKLVRISGGTPDQEIARFMVEIADEPDEWRRGLMERPRLAPDAGMLFVFPEPAPRAFWMMKTLVRLDILFVDANGRILNIKANVPPCRPPRRCPTYHSVAPAKYVLEIAGGRAHALGVRAGDQLRFWLLGNKMGLRRDPAADVWFPDNSIGSRDKQ